MKIWICIPVFNRINYTIKFLNSISKQTYQDFKIIICDHGSTDGTSEIIKRDYPDTVIINAQDDLWWTGAINLCITYVLQNANITDKVLTINNDTELPIDYLSNFVKHAIKYPEAILASVIYNIETKKCTWIGNRQNWLLAKERPVSFEKDHIPGNPELISITHASGRGTLFPISVYKKVGLYDVIHLPHYSADYDFTHKARRQGYLVYVCKDCIVYAYIEAGGLTQVRQSFSLKSLKDYLFSIRSPANIKVRWWYGFNNCPKLIFPLYLLIDYTRIIGSFFKYYLIKK